MKLVKDTNIEKFQTLTEGIIKPKEKQELKWVYPKELKNYPMPPADIPLIAILRDWV